MAKTRIYEIARDLNFTSKEMVQKLNDLGFAVKSALNSVDKETADRMISLLMKDEKVKNPVAAPKKSSSKKKRSSVKSAAASAVKEKVISLAGPVKVSQLAQKLGVKTKILIREQKRQGVHLRGNESISVETAMEIADSYGFDVEEVPLELEGMSLSSGDLVGTTRSPVVTILGHVDHGKTTLLDYIRQTRVAAREDGGITQHIGAYQIDYKDGRISFIDTPGHAAFSAMRARGALVTDIVVLIVSADDGVMPQTIEAINHAKAAEVPIIVAVNKIDKANADPGRVRQDLIKHDLLSEELGGETIVVDISAKTGDGIDDLLEMILLQAEMMELTGNPQLPARGTILEARLDKGRGPVATVLIQSGTLNRGDAFVVGLHWGKARAMANDQGSAINSAGPAFPVEVIGLSGVPEPGDELVVVPSEKRAKQISSDRQREVSQAEPGKKKRATLDELFSMMQGSDKKELKVIIKADVQGSIEAIRDAFNKIQSKKIDVQILHSGVGTVLDTDVNLASTTDSMIIGYRVKPNGATTSLGNQLGVDIRLYKVIYELIEDIEQAMLGMLDPGFREVDLGQALVKELFIVPKVGTIAGCICESGKIQKNALVRILRDSVLIHEGQVDSLRHFKDNVKEVQAGQECGIKLASYNDIKVNDVIEAYFKEEVEVEL